MKNRQGRDLRFLVMEDTESELAYSGETGLPSFVLLAGGGGSHSDP